jgi:hypothetical protein
MRTFWKFNVVMDGTQEVPPNSSPGIGTAIAIFNDNTGQMDIDGSFSGLLVAASNAHLHGYSTPGVASGVVFGLTFTPATSGTVSGSGVIPSARIADVLNGLTYTNIHSAMFPSGEIRGQLMNPVAVPEPGGGGWLGVSAASWLLHRRRGRE